MAIEANLQETVRELVAAATGTDRSAIDSSTSMASLGLDSLGIVAIAAQCSVRFGVEIGTSDVLQLYVAEDFAEFVATIRTSIERCRVR